MSTLAKGDTNNVSSAIVVSSCDCDGGRRAKLKPLSSGVVERSRVLMFVNEMECGTVMQFTSTFRGLNVHEQPSCEAGHFHGSRAHLCKCTGKTRTYHSLFSHTFLQTTWSQ